MNKHSKKKLNYLNRIGAHLRLDEQGIVHGAQRALQLNLPCFQIFITAPPAHDKYLKVNLKERTIFKELRKQFDHIYIHSSYWINASTGKKESYSISRSLLRKEIRIAQQLDISYIVLHCGSAKGYPESPDDPLNKKRGILALAKMLNAVLKNEPSVKILLENTAHGNQVIGSDFSDFLLLKKHLIVPERIGFCIDFAHAHAFGYDLGNINKFVTMIDQTIGLTNIFLLHVNDTEEILGSKKDRHAITGAGKIGKDVLTQLLNHPAFINVPKIIEPPLMDTEQMVSLLNEINSWIIDK